MNEKDFVIGKVAWLTHMKSDPPLSEEQKNLYRLRYELLFKFLQEHQLTTRTLLKEGETVNDESEFRVSDLTETGFKVIKKALPKWEAKIDKAKDKFKATNDLSLFEKALEELKSN
jgi:hypothetical protein